MTDDTHPTAPGRSGWPLCLSRPRSRPHRTGASCCASSPSEGGAQMPPAEAGRHRVALVGHRPGVREDLLPDQRLQRGRQRGLDPSVILGGVQLPVVVHERVQNVDVQLVDAPRHRHPRDLQRCDDGRDHPAHEFALRLELLRLPCACFALHRHQVAQNGVHVM
eukprot:3619359-Prymnesium_polylepis.1